MPENRVSVTASAPGKTNLYFAVGPLLPDGFHDVASVYVALDLREEVTVTTSENWKVSVAGTVSGLQLNAVPTGEDNLVVKAAKKVIELAGLNGEVHPVNFAIDKRVPVAGGMGGGSADAAAALVAVNELWCTGVDFDGFNSKAAKATVALGADVPFALAGGLAIGLGRGEKLSPIASDIKLHLVLVTSDEGLSTPAVYRRLDELRVAQGVEPSRAEEAIVPSEVIDAIQAGDVAKLATVLRNDLQEAALDLRPELRKVIDAGIEAGALTGFVSGSGPTIAFLAADADGAETITQRLLSKGYAALATAGPAAGTFIKEKN